MSKTRRNNRLQPSAAKTRKHRKQSGGVIPDIKLHKKEDGLLLLKQSLSNFGMPDKRHPTLKEIQLQELKDIEALNKIYINLYQHEQIAMKKILAESIYNNGKKGDFKYSEDELDLPAWPQFAKSIEYKAFVDELCFPKTKRSQSYTAASASNKTSVGTSIRHNAQKTSSEEKADELKAETLANSERIKGYSESTQRLKKQLAIKAAEKKKKKMR